MILSSSFFSFDFLCSSDLERGIEELHLLAGLLIFSFQFSEFLLCVSLTCVILFMHN